MGEKKSFQEILDEHLRIKSQTPAAPSTDKPTSAPYTFEFDFSFLGLPPIQPKVKAAAYPAPAPKKPMSVAPPPPRLKDQFLEVAKLSGIEMAALQAFDLNADGLLSRRELKAKYRALVRRLHPDHHTAALTTMERKVLTEKFHRVLEAYELLSQAFSRLIPTQQ